MAIKNFIDYIVSDNPNKYPDGAVHTDGYYYERVADLLPLFGCTKMAVDDITFSSDTAMNNLAIPHSLGAFPKYAFIIGSYDAIPSTNNIILNCLMKPLEDENSYFTLIRSYNSLVASANTSNIYCSYSNTTSNQIYLTGTTAYMFGKDVHYKLITMA